MSEMIAWMAAEAEKPKTEENSGLLQNRRKASVDVDSLPAHTFGESPAEDCSEERRDAVFGGLSEENISPYEPDLDRRNETIFEFNRRQRIYRGRTVRMLRRYMRHSIETGRLPSLLGREFFRSNVSSYEVTTFEDRVIFVHDMERCLHRLDGFSQTVLGRVVLQDYSHEDAARVLGCTRMTVHRTLIMALDELARILVSVGLIDRLSGDSEKSCQGGQEADLFVSYCEESK